MQLLYSLYFSGTLTEMDLQAFMMDAAWSILERSLVTVVAKRLLREAKIVSVKSELVLNIPSSLRLIAMSAKSLGVREDAKSASSGSISAVAFF